MPKPYTNEFGDDIVRVARNRDSVRLFTMESSAKRIYEAVRHE